MVGGRANAFFVHPPWIRVYFLYIHVLWIYLHRFAIGTLCHSVFIVFVFRFIKSTQIVNRKYTVVSNICMCCRLQSTSLFTI